MRISGKQCATNCIHYFPFYPPFRDINKLAVYCKPWRSTAIRVSSCLVPRPLPSSRMLQTVTRVGMSFSYPSGAGLPTDPSWLAFLRHPLPDSLLPDLTFHLYGRVPSLLLPSDSPTYIPESTTAHFGSSSSRSAFSSGILTFASPPFRASSSLSKERSGT